MSELKKNPQRSIKSSLYLQRVHFLQKFIILSWKQSTLFTNKFLTWKQTIQFRLANTHFIQSTISYASLITRGFKKKIRRIIVGNRIHLKGLSNRRVMYFCFVNVICWLWIQEEKKLNYRITGINNFCLVYYIQLF